MNRAAAEPLRILGYFSFPGGGIGRYTHHLFNELARDPGLNVELLTQPDFVWRGQARYRLNGGLLRISDPRALLRKSRFLVGQFANPRRLAARSRILRPHVVHFADVNQLLLPLWERAVFGHAWRVVMTVHDVRRMAAIIERRWESRELRRVYRLCDALFVHSRSQRDELTDYAKVSPDRVYVVPHGPYPFARYGGGLSRAVLRRKWAVPEEAVTILFFGFIKPYKGLDILLEALSLIAPQSPLHVLVAGSGGGRFGCYLDQCRRLMKSPGVSARVTTVLRHIEEDEVPELLAISDAIALPYRASFTSQSGVLNVASHARLPIVATPAPAFVEGQENGDIGIIARDFTVEAYAGALRELVERSTAEWAFERYLESNSWRRNAEVTGRVYRELVAA